MTPPDNTKLHCTDEHGATFVGQYASIADVTRARDVAWSDDMDKLRWWMLFPSGEWWVCKKPTHWEIPHGADHQWLLDQLEIAKRK